ncbi:MAG: hypothetical protein NZ874_08695 [Fimbriimonadales bacterium]|nr:hypothetical protein [Fimbriimonadales bacterium]
MFDTRENIWAAFWMIGAAILIFALIPLLQTLPPRGRYLLIAFVTFIAGLFFAAEFFLPVDEKTGKNFLTDPFQRLQGSLQVITALSLGLGTYGLIRLHLRNAVQRRAQWGYSIVLLVSFVTMAFFSVWNTLAEKGLLGVQRTPLLERAFTLLFDYTLVQLDATMFSLIAFYIFSAAYRAFRIRSVEASILMFTAMIVMIGIVPLGKFISDSIGLPIMMTDEMRTNPFALETILYSLRLPEVANWILNVLNAPVQRAIEFGVGIGALAMAIRLWLSLERGIT